MNDKTILTVLIVDDEAPARQKLQMYVQNDIRFEVAGQAKNGPQALEQITALQPDLLLLDIQMPGMTGFDVLRLLEGPSPAIIFTTAYDQYAVQAFEVSAIDYLLKPIKQDRLNQALDKVFTLGKTNWNEKINTVLEKLQIKAYAKKLAVRKLDRVHLLNTQDIRYIVSEHRLINIYAEDGQSYWTNENLVQLAARLNPDKFMRIHRSAIVNLDAKFEVEPWNSGRLRLHFSKDEMLTVSRENVAALRERLAF